MIEWDIRSTIPQLLASGQLDFVQESQPKWTTFPNRILPFLGYILLIIPQSLGRSKEPSTGNFGFNTQTQSFP